MDPSFKLIFPVVSKSSLNWSDKYISCNPIASLISDLWSLSLSARAIVSSSQSFLASRIYLWWSNLLWRKCSQFDGLPINTTYQRPNASSSWSNSTLDCSLDCWWHFGTQNINILFRKSRNCRDSVRLIRDIKMVQQSLRVTSLIRLTRANQREMSSSSSRPRRLTMMLPRSIE